MIMSIGTKSLLFGVHQFLWHPAVVGLAWRKLHGRWPTWEEWVAIVVHDWGYWGCQDMDGPGGVNHPLLGAKVAESIVYFFHRDFNRAYRIFCLSAGHSASYAEKFGLETSDLHGPDKYSVVYEPWWFYRMRGMLTGEIYEYMEYGPKGLSPRQWFRWLQGKFKRKYEAT